MDGEDPLLTKKRVEKRYSNRIESRYSKEETNSKKRELKPGDEIFKPWDDKPDVALAVNQASPESKKTPNRSIKNILQSSSFRAKQSPGDGDSRINLAKAN